MATIVFIVGITIPVVLVLLGLLGLCLFFSGISDLLDGSSWRLQRVRSGRIFLCGGAILLAVSVAGFVFR